MTYIEKKRKKLIFLLQVLSSLLVIKLQLIPSYRIDIFAKNNIFFGLKKV